MLVLGIESSAHTFGVGIVDGSKVLANEKEQFRVGRTGMVPSKVADLHIKNAKRVIERALHKSGKGIDEIEGIGYTRGPGIGPCLQVGELSAKTLAMELKVNIAPVNHAVGHIEIAKHFARMKDPVALYVSGGNSQILKMDAELKRYRVLGETFDIGIGNMLDSFARKLKLNPAWGSSIAALAEKGRYISLPYTVKGTDFSFTGLLTRCTELVGKEKKEDLCYSMQETAFAMLCEATERALLLTNSRELLVCGGVAQSKRLREMLAVLSKSHGIRFGYAPDEFNADNGAMIALVAEKMLTHGLFTPADKCDISQRYRIEDARVI